MLKILRCPPAQPPTDICPKDFQNNSQCQKSTTTPYFSIIIPFYNSEAFLERCILSCINQSFKDLEIILIDDCGTDDSKKIAQHFASIQTQIRLINNPKNLGVFHSRLAGIDCSRGKYCLFVDSDDFLDKNACQIIYQKLQKEEVDILHFNFTYFPSRIKRFALFQRDFALNKNIESINLDTSFQSLCDKAIKTSILKKDLKDLQRIHPPLNVMEDGLMVLIISLNAKTYRKIQKNLYFYQNNPNSTTKDISLSSFERKITSYLEILRILPHFKKQNIKKSHIFNSFEKKILSAFILEARFFKKSQLLQITQKIKKSSLINAICINLFPPFLGACIISSFYFFRWQTVARILFYILSFGKVKL